MKTITIKTTIKNIIKAMEEARQQTIRVAVHLDKKGDRQEAENTIKRYNDRCLEASNICCTLCITCSEVGSNLSNYLDEVQTTLLCDMALNIWDTLDCE